MKAELKPCPYSKATECSLAMPCGGCEIYCEYLAGETTPRTDMCERKQEGTYVYTFKDGWVKQEG